jgi:hypothetical protein
MKMPIGDKPVVPLFQLGGIGPKPQLELLGLPSGWKVESKAGGSTVTISGDGDKFTAELAVGDDGKVTISGDRKKLSEWPLLGLAVIKVTSEGRSVYRQLFRLKDQNPVKLPPPQKPSEGGFWEYTLDPAGEPPFKGEYLRFVEEKATVALGPVAWVTVGEETFELLPPADHNPNQPLTRLESRVRHAKVALIAASLEGGRVVFRTKKDDGARAPSFTVEAIEVVRPIKGLNGMVQNLFRVR